MAATVMSHPLLTNLTLDVGRTPIVSDVHRHEHLESRPASMGLAFDDPAVVAHDLGRQSKSKANVARSRNPVLGILLA